MVCLKFVLLPDEFGLLAFPCRSLAPQWMLIFASWLLRSCCCMCLLHVPFPFNALFGLCVYILHCVYPSTTDGSSAFTL